MKPAQQKTMTRKSKFWLGLLLIVLGCAFFGGIGVLGFHECFPGNSRLMLKEIEIRCPTQCYWNPKSQLEKEDRVRKLRGLLGLDGDDIHLYDPEKIDPAAMKEKIKRHIPEIERVSVYRVMPDKLVFDIRERIPIAALEHEMYLDRQGNVLNREPYEDLRGILPHFVVFQPGVKRPAPGERLSEMANIQAGIDMIELIQKRSDFSDISVRRIIFFKDFFLCDLKYRDDPVAFSVSIPVDVDKETMERDVFGRLIPQLRDAYRKSGNHIINLTFEGQAVSRNE